MIVLDTSVALAWLDADDERHVEAKEWGKGSREELVTTPLVIAEIDHLVARYGGPAAVEGLRSELEAGAYGVEWWSGALARAIEIARRHAGLGLGLTDASLVALAARLETTRVATFDERHFRVVPPLTGEPAFTLLPADA